MATSNCIPLNDDILDRIFTYCPDFETLHSLTLGCKALHAVFSGHPNSINTAVAHNLIGPAFPEALKHLRYVLSDHESDEEPDSTPALAGINAASLITPAEKAPLSSNAAVVCKLEVIFSRWYDTVLFQLTLMVIHPIVGTRIGNRTQASSHHKRLSASGVPCTAS